VTSHPGRRPTLEIGSSLREARRRRGVELIQAEAATMIRGRYLEALEDERFDQLPAGPYARSFLREYAEFLGLDGDMLANEYALRFEPAEPEPPTPPPLSRADGVMRWLDGVPFGRVLVALGVVALVAVGVIELGGTGGGSPAPATHPTPPPTTRTQTTSSPAKHTTPPAAPKPASLVLTAARGRCWLSVHVGSSSGPTVYQSTLEQGQTLRFGLRRPLWIRIGAPPALDARIGSHSLTASLPTRTGNVLVTRNGVQPAA
jgi:Helix-turn-helix domain/RodZ C-terminal domain